MSVVALSPAAAAGVVDQKPVVSGGAPQGPERAFSQSMKQAKIELSSVLWPKADLHRELTGLQQRIESGQGFSSRELLLYQFKASRFHLQVELISKTAESLLGALRKFQNPS